MEILLSGLNDITIILQTRMIGPGLAVATLRALVDFYEGEGRHTYDADVLQGQYDAALELFHERAAALPDYEDPRATIARYVQDTDRD